MSDYWMYIEVMYIATVPNRNSPPAILLRESFRENGKVRNRTLANLSRWPAARIEALRRLLGGEFDQAIDLSQGPQLGRVFGLTAAGLRYITALTDMQIRRLLGQGILQLSLFSEQVCEVQAAGVRYILRKNPAEAEREQHRREDKLAKLEAKMAARNQQVREHPRCQPEAGRRALEAWAGRHKLTGLVAIPLEGTQ